MAWVMTSKRVRGGIEVCVGALKIAEVVFIDNKEALLYVLQPNENFISPIPCNSVSHAFHTMHEKLNSPPPEGFEVPKFKKETPE